MYGRCRKQLWRSSSLIMQNKNALVVFVRNPEKGSVKTRIAETAGDDKALSIYLRLLEHTKAVAERVEADTFVFYSNEIAVDDLWDGSRFFKEKQEGVDLGERMQKAFATVFSKGYQKVCIIGSDCYDLIPEHVETAFGKLHLKDLVAGPAEDGGYYLLGMKRMHTALFGLKAWSTEFVLQETLLIAEALDLSCATLPVLSDIDTEADWEAALSKRAQR